MSDPIRFTSKYHKVFEVLFAVGIVWWIYLVYRQLAIPTDADCLHDSFCSAASNSVSGFLMATFAAFASMAVVTAILSLYLLLIELYHRHKILAIVLFVLLSCALLFLGHGFFATPQQ
jgi:hypothetical protein